jgi:hypothetical protein
MDAVFSEVDPVHIAYVEWKATEVRYISKPKGPSLIGCPRLLIQHIGSYPVLRIVETITASNTPLFLFGND